MRIAAATNNQNKINEIHHIFTLSGLDDIEILSAQTLNIVSEPVKDSQTLAMLELRHCLYLIRQEYLHLRMIQVYL